MANLIPDDDYKRCVRDLPIATVDLVIFNKEKTKVLLFKRENEPLKGIFYFPGGRIHKNETVEKTIVRMTKEELSIDIDIRDLIFGGYQEEIFDKSIYKNIGAHFINLFFGMVAAEKLPIRLNTQHNDFQWFPINDKDLHPYAKKKIDTLIPKLRP